jgi:hypothetical protein
VTQEPGGLTGCLVPRAECRAGCQVPGACCGAVRDRLGAARYRASVRIGFV